MPIGDFTEIHVQRQHGYYGDVFPVMAVLRGADPQASLNFRSVFFKAEGRPYKVVGISSRHETAASDGALQVYKVPDGTAVSSGTNVLGSDMDLTASAATWRDGVLSSDDADLLIKSGEGLGLDATGLLASLENLSINVYLKAV